MFNSPYDKAGGIVWFPRMLGKIRLQSNGDLPQDYHSYMGRGFDDRCARFLEVDYQMIVKKTLEGLDNEDAYEWCASTGNRPSENEKLVWNDFMLKRGWRDSDAAENELKKYKEKYGLGHRDDVLTYFDFFEVDEGRKT